LPCEITKAQTVPININYCFILLLYTEKRQTANPCRCLFAQLLHPYKA
jgi:hypothetical protein